MNKILRNSILKKLVKTITGMLLIIIIIFSAEWFLSKNEPVNANLLVVEGWLPNSAIQMTKEEFNNHQYDYLVTTGLILDESDFFMMAYNGYLIVYPRSLSDLNNGRNSHLIEIVAHSKNGGKYRSHFNFYVNDSLVIDFKVDKKLGKYKVNWSGYLHNIDSLMIEFDNDLADNWGDCNLYIKEIIIDDSIHISYQFNSVYDMGLLDSKKRMKNDFGSYAEIGRNNLIASGIDSSDVIAVPGRRGKINRTFASSLAFKEWLDKSGIDVKGINIVSQGAHSRRTWITYKKVMGKTYDVGIIALPENDPGNSRIQYLIKIFYESIGYVYYWLILTFIYI